MFATPFVYLLRGMLSSGGARPPRFQARRLSRGRPVRVYPDVTVIYGPPAFQPETSEVITNPSIVAEVLSGSTEEYDRGLKWTGYQRISALTDYLLVHRDRTRIEHY